MRGKERSSALMFQNKQNVIEMPDIIVKSKIQLGHTYLEGAIIWLLTFLLQYMSLSLTYF